MQSPSLVWLEVVTVASYLACFVLYSLGWREVVTAATWLDLLGHSTIAAWITGPESGFQFYSWILLLLVFTNPYRNVHTKTCVAIGLSITYVLLDWGLHQTKPLENISPDTIIALRYFNLSAFLLAMTVTAVLFARFVVSVETHLRAVAGIDSLTGLLNRHCMWDHMRDTLTIARKHGKAPAVLLLDIDHFKMINDRYGHNRGDYVLERIGKILRQSVRQHDFVARWGGEEFLVMLPDTTIEVAVEAAERIRHAIFSGVQQSETDPAPISVTVGVALWQKDEHLETTIHRADLALYDGKRAGRNHVVTDREQAIVRLAS